MYEVIGEDVIFDRAWKIALQTGASGFDTYFITTADILNAVLITDDASMASKAREIGIATLLVREVSLEKLINYLRDPPPYRDLGSGLSGASSPEQALRRKRLITCPAGLHWCLRWR